mmetsp:Transcript_2743/g.6995  ORF Transcript_2743/g.6995 Transcript_2743/m.6995 type:complete len:146 (+) Transcript_2743:91-528(+)|eukprot:6044579-Amphidinium_carterae.2
MESWTTIRAHGDELESINIEATARRVEILGQSAGLQETSKFVVTPGVNAKTSDTSEALDLQESTLFNSMAMRANCLALNRQARDIVRCQRGSSTGIEEEEEEVKRIARHLHVALRMVQRIYLQDHQATLDTYSDANHGTCLLTSK